MSIASNLYVVLVEPQYRGNVGAVARVMNNFGFLNLRLVGAIPEREDHVIAVHSEDILDNAEKSIFQITESQVSKTYQPIGKIMHRNRPGQCLASWDERHAPGFILDAQKSKLRAIGRPDRVVSAAALVR